MRTRFVRSAPDGHLSKPLSLFLPSKNMASIDVTNSMTSCYYCELLSDSECFREMALFMGVKKPRIYQRLGMNQLKCKSELKCK